MNIRLNNSSNVVTANFANADMVKEDYECASLKWIGTVTADTVVALTVSGSRVIVNDIIIPNSRMQISY